MLHGGEEKEEHGIPQVSSLRQGLRFSKWPSIEWESLGGVLRLEKAIQIGFIYIKGRPSKDLSKQV